MTWLVVGLGNPGEEYAATRHNAGAMVVDLLASRANERLKKIRFIPVDVAQTNIAGETVYLAKSHRYMNESGPSYASFAKKREIDPAHVICVHDEIDLEFGVLRVKFGGSTAGHNGLNSLVGGLKTPDFARVRLGVGRPPGRSETVDYVLKPFSKSERPEVDVLVQEAADAIVSLIESGLERTQDEFNKPRSS